MKHSQSVSITPVVFGIRQSLARELGFTDGDVSVKEILDAISSEKMTFCMTSATQSNSGASAYIGFLYALLGKQDGLTEADLQDEQLQEEIRTLLRGVDRSSGSSDWLKDMFLEGDYDAMVNYECLIIDANEQLVAEGKEPLQVVYPYDGLSMADSPLGYVDHGDDEKEEAFLTFQETLLGSESQQAIEATGRRITANGVSEENREVFNPDWGIDTERILSPIQMPGADVLLEALNLYQTNFKKPSLNIYCLDFSGSMSGDGSASSRTPCPRSSSRRMPGRTCSRPTTGKWTSRSCLTTASRMCSMRKTIRMRRSRISMTRSRIMSRVGERIFTDLRRRPTRSRLSMICLSIRRR